MVLQPQNLNPIACKINQAWFYGLEALRAVACLHACWPSCSCYIAACLHKINVIQTIRGLLNTRIVRLLTASVIMFPRDKFFYYHVNLLHTLTLKVLKNNFHSLSSAEAPLDKGSCACMNLYNSCTRHQMGISILLCHCWAVKVIGCLF